MAAQKQEAGGDGLQGFNRLLGFSRSVMGMQRMNVLRSDLRKAVTGATTEVS